MKYVQLLIILSTLIISCTSDKTAIDNFYSCLTVEQRTALRDLESVCNRFIKHNYPEMDTDEGYKQFLKDIEAEREAWTTDDSIAVMNLNQRLKATFGEYIADKAFFSALSPVTTCLKKTSNSKFVNKFVEDNYSCGGGLGPNLIAWSIINNKLDPTSGQVKIIYQTEVVYRILFLNTTKISFSQ